MAGSGTFAVQAQPNMTAVFTPHPNYWVIFGNFENGDVMDIQDVTQAVEVTMAAPHRAHGRAEPRQHDHGLLT